MNLSSIPVLNHQSSMTDATAATYRVDNMPWALKPWFWIYGYGLGLLYHLYFCCVRWSSRIEHVKSGQLDTDDNYIYCLWHQDFLAYFCSFPQHARHTWINHPVWNMKPIHVCMRLAGIRIILGSSGHDGREAADRLAVAIRGGDSTVISPDGPSGPPKTLKKGAFHIAAQSGVSIVPVRFKASRYWELNTWDRKRLPQPFSTIRAELGKPLQVDRGNLEAAMHEILAALESRD